MKKLIYTLFFVFISVVANGQAKYVFYFIGDGMGVNQVMVRRCIRRKFKMAVLVLNLCYLLNSRLLLWQLLSLLKFSNRLCCCRYCISNRQEDL